MVTMNRVYVVPLYRCTGVHCSGALVYLFRYTGVLVVTMNRVRGTLRALSLGLSASPNVSAPPTHHDDKSK